MTSTTVAVASGDLYLILRDAGLVPGNCGDVIIEMRAGDAVRIHCQSFPDERIVPVLRAFVHAAKVDSPKEPAQTDGGEPIEQ